jgi:hypothetical protein
MNRDRNGQDAEREGLDAMAFEFGPICRRHPIRGGGLIIYTHRTCLDRWRKRCDSTSALLSFALDAKGFDTQ